MTAGLTTRSLAPLLPEMAALAVQAWPEEACGLVLERSGVLRVVGCLNEQNALHQSDPVRYPRDARTAYSLDPRQVISAERDGFVLRAVFHSHPDRGAYFSEEDVTAALGGTPGGQPVLPGVDYIVLASRRDRVEETRLYRWAPAERRFEEHSRFEDQS